MRGGLLLDSGGVDLPMAYNPTLAMLCSLKRLVQVPIEKG